jgi:hypothetical protein
MVVGRVMRRKRLERNVQPIGRIYSKLKQVKYRHLQKELRAAFKIDPVCCPNCRHEFRVRDKETIKADFEDFISNASRAEIAYRYPDMAALLWVLEDGDAEPESVEVSLSEIMDNPPVPMAEGKVTEIVETPEGKPGLWSSFVSYFKRLCRR